MEYKEQKQRLLTICLLIGYLLILTWIIIFKMQFSFKSLDHFRGINLIPFHESVIINGKISITEILNNVIVFIPLGIYISMLKTNWSLFKKIIPIVSVSLLFEIL